MSKPLHLPKIASPGFGYPGEKPRGAVEVDWDNPITREMSFCIVPPTLRELVRGEPCKDVLNAAAADNKHGLGHRVESNATVASWEDNDGVLISTDFTVLVWLRVEAKTGSLYTYFSHRDSFAESAWFLYENTGAGGTPLTWGVMKSGLQERTSSTFAYSNLPAVGEDVCIGVAGDAAGLDMHVRRNGSLESESLSALTPTNTSNNHDFNLGTLQNGGADYRVDGIYHAAMVWKRKLSTAEVGVVSHNPWQVLRPTQQPLYLVPSAGGGGTTPKGPLGHPLFGPLAGPVGL